MVRLIGKLLLAFGAIIALAQGNGSGGALVTPAVAAEPAPVPVNLRVDVFFNGSHVPLILGVVDGIFKKHGLDVTLLSGRGSATTLQTVANGSDQFGYADGGVLIRLAAQGLRAKQIVGMLELNPMTVFTMPNAGVRVPKDLDGKTGGFSPGSSPEEIFPAFAKKTGIDINTIKRVLVDIPTRDSIFLAGKTQFSFGYTVVQIPILQEKCACKLKIFHYSDYGLTAISNGIVVSDKYATAHPDVVHRMAAAVVEAMNLAVKHPKHAVDDFFAFAPHSKLSRAVVAQQWDEAIKLMHTPATAHDPLGTMSRSDWQKTIDLLVAYAGVPKGAVTPDMVFTNGYLPQ